MNMLRTVTKRSCLITATMAGVLALSLSEVSTAADKSDVPRAVVKFGDLNVSNPLGATILYDRIEAAADSVCQFDDTDVDPLGLGYYLRQKECVHKAIARAVRKMDISELFAIYNARNHRRH